MDRLKDKVALITGGGSGIGRATSLLFAREGAKVAVADYAAEGGEETVRLIAAAGGAAVFVRADVSRSADVRQMIATTVHTYGRLDILFNNAGIEGPSAKIVNYPEEEWERVLAIDLTAVYLGMKYAIPEMLKQGGGVIISTASVAGMVGFPGSGAYGAAKAGVIQLTRTAALEYASKNIRVNCICPGVIRTPMAQRVMGDRPEEATVRLEPIGRLGTPEDIANAALFLASDESSFATGAPFIIDGGYVAR
ncbi:MAG: glucose 1-dehydrogenase [Thermodesulfobacteriota bacterium]|jgi:NAD(P)-dependent dehydrogenase (short-subunit alcohol dehydrogenase family)